MRDFYIEKVTVTGPNQPDSEIEFKDGLNIIHGPSNTGKSMILDCIDYMFGASEAPFNPNNTGYNCVHMSLKNKHDDSEIVLSRKVLVDNTSSKADSKITIQSTFSEIDSGEYSTSSNNTFNNEIIKLLGVDSAAKIIASQEGKPQSFTLRTFIHQFLLKEDHIFRKSTILDNPKRSAITPCLTSLMYLIDERGTVDGDFESTQVKKAKKKAVTDYISEKFKYIEKRQKELRELLELSDGSNPEQKISEVMTKIDNTQKAIDEADTKCRNLVSEILVESGKMQEAQFLNERYAMLQSQYESDIERLELIVLGEQSIDNNTTGKCPFCSNEISTQDTHKSYVTASSAELNKLKIQLKELHETIKGVEGQINTHDAHLSVLQSKHDDTNNLLKGSLRPYMEQLNEELKNYRRIAELTTELEANDKMYEVFNFDYNVEEAKDTKADSFDAKTRFDDSVFAQLAIKTSDTIKACGYDSFRSATISRKDFDVVVNNKDKRDQGKGHRAFLNSAFAFALMKFLEENAQHAPMMLLLDSPILSLKESEDEKITSAMKSTLFKYFVNNTGNCQVIIAENELPQGEIDYKGTKFIEFTKSENDGRYGFLASHR